MAKLSRYFTFEYSDPPLEECFNGSWNVGGYASIKYCCTVHTEHSSGALERNLFVGFIQFKHLSSSSAVRLLLGLAPTTECTIRGLHGWSHIAHAKRRILTTPGCYDIGYWDEYDTWSHVSGIRNPSLCDTDE